MPHVANVTVNSSQVTSDHTDFTVYVDLSDLPTTEFWGTVTNGGGDIRCYKSDGTTELAREVVSCDTATDTGELHVRYDGTLSSSVDTEIQIWTDEGTEPAVTATYGRNAVWADYEAVWHMGDTVDSTGNGNTLSLTGSPSVVSGPLGDAYGLNGSSQYMSAADSSFLDVSAPLTLQAVLEPDTASSTSTFYTILDKTNANSNAYRLLITDDGSGGSDIRGRYPNLSPSNTNGAASWAASEYIWIGSSVSSSGVTNSYFQGASVGSETTSGTIATTSNSLGIGNVNFGTSGQFDGIFDETRISDRELSANWIADEYTNQNTPSTFYTASAAGGTPVTVTLSNASETDTALPTSISPIIELDFGFAAETDTAEAITISANVNVALGVASETDTALPTTIAPTQLVTFSAATEADSALPVTVTVDVTVPIGVASEADTALPMEFLTTIFLSLGVADEVDNALRVAINAGGSFSRGALNDAMIQYFNQRGYNGALSGQMIEWLQANGATSANLPDAWMEMLNAKITAPVESWNDAWFYLLGVNGFTQGTLPDRQLAFFLSNANLLGE